MDLGKKNFIIQLDNDRIDLKRKIFVAMDSNSNSSSSSEQLKCNEVLFLDESLNDGEDDGDATNDGDNNDDYYDDDARDTPEFFVEGEEVDLSQPEDGIVHMELATEIDDCEEPYQDSAGVLYYICEKCTFVCIDHATLVQHTNEKHPKNQPQRPRNNNSALRSSGTGHFLDDFIHNKEITLSQKQPVTSTKSISSPVQPSSPVQSTSPLPPQSPSSSVTLSTSLFEDLKPYECEICHKRLSTRANLRGHMTIHSNEKPFACHLCTKRFKQKRHLQYHQKIHNFKSLSYESGPMIKSNKESFQLQLVENDESNESYEFDHETAVNVLQLRSNGKKAIGIENHPQRVLFQCNQCPKVYTQKCNLYRHQRTHTPIYPCKICQKKFKIEQNLQEHMKTHTLADRWRVNERE